MLHVILLVSPISLIIHHIYADWTASGSRSTLFQKDRMMTRFPYIEKQAFALLSNAETASDRYLIQLVRLQRIFERIDDAVVNTASSVREADMHRFQTEIDQYKMTLSTEFSDNCEWHSSLKEYACDAKC